MQGVERGQATSFPGRFPLLRSGRDGKALGTKLRRLAHDISVPFAPHEKYSRSNCKLLAKENSAPVICSFGSWFLCSSIC